jgi:hypothetical protein
LFITDLRANTDTERRLLIQIIPSGSKGLLDSLKTNSYHIKTVLECSIPTKKDSSTTVRLVIQRDDHTKKRYDFEAENHVAAGELFSITGIVFWISIAMSCAAVAGGDIGGNNKIGGVATNHTGLR